MNRRISKRSTSFGCFSNRSQKENILSGSIEPTQTLASRGPLASSSAISSSSDSASVQPRQGLSERWQKVHPAASLRQESARHRGEITAPRFGKARVQLPLWRSSALLQ